jgi:hypothetical protein
MILDDVQVKEKTQNLALSIRASCSNINKDHWSCDDQKQVLRKTHVARETKGCAAVTGE